ncbi:MAG: hypothetical protein IIZ80_06205 [Erysipelotrichaceae bacterium]|nr:hypothetical protein [Erysipelotrichaceae bacterium]
MKKIFTILSVLTLLILPYQLKAEADPEDMSVFRIAILLQHCDQSDQIKVVRLKNTVTGEDAFCLEPYVNYKPSSNIYYKVAENNKKLYDLYCAYEQLGKSDDAFITIQLMIWEELFDQQFTFDGKGASDYLKQEVLEILEQAENEPDIINEEVYTGTEQRVAVPDLDKYDITSDVTIIKADEEGITFAVSEYSPDILQIRLEPKSSVPEGAFSYVSENSQDIYSFEGEHESLNSILINIKVLEDDLSLTYSKTDPDGNPIKGAQFTLYRIDPEAEDILYFLKSGSQIDLYEMLTENIGTYDRNHLSLDVSERYSVYINDGIILTDELGYFPFVLRYNDAVINEGRVYVTDDIDEGFAAVNVEKIKTVESAYESENTLNGLKHESRYYFCESEPEKGYTYTDKPCRIVDTSDDSYLEKLHFINESRSYTLKLIKNNPDRTIALNGALFSLKYREKGEEKQYIFKTGALNIFKEDEYRYLIYRYEDTNDYHVREFTADQYIEEGVPYGKYYYYLSNDTQIDPSRIDRETTVAEGSFLIEDLPYSAGLKLEELEAPKGYFIDEASFELNADIGYCDITFTNSRVNTFDIIPGNQRKIPKTCIGD